MMSLKSSEKVRATDPPLTPPPLKVRALVLDHLALSSNSKFLA